jgi:hypothetical protein
LVTIIISSNPLVREDRALRGWSQCRVQRRVISDPNIAVVRLLLQQIALSRRIAARMSLAMTSTARSNARLSHDGVFANGVTAAAVVQFIRDYDEAARIEDVAAHFHLEVADVDAALRYQAHASREQARFRTSR